MQIPIDGGFYQSDALPIAALECTNFYPNAPQVGGALSAGTLLGTPGIAELTTTGAVSQINRGSHTMAGIPYFVNGTTLYSLDRTVDAFGVETFGTTSLGTVTGTQRVSMADNGAQLMIVVNSIGYIYSVAGGFVTITDLDFQGNGVPQSVVFIDSFFVCTTDTKKIIKSAANDGTAWNALDFASAEADPDDIVAPAVFKNQLFVFGSETTEVFENRGLGGFPFQRITGFIIEKGLSAKEAVAKTSDNLMFLGAGVNETPAMWKMEGSSVAKVSTTAIDDAISQMSDTEISNCFAWSYVQSGAYFVAFVFASRCFVFDTIASKWHERKSRITDVLSAVTINRCRVNSLVAGYGHILVGDSQDGRIGRLDHEVYQEYDESIIRTVTTNPIYAEGRAFSITELELTMESGVSNDTTVRLSVSKDAKTWGNEIARSYGAIGQYGSRAIWRKLGRFPRFGVLKFETSDNSKAAVIRLDAKIAIMQ